MIRNWSIRNRVLLLALLPVISLGVVLSGYFVQSRVRDLKAAQSTLGRTMADQLASASLYGVLMHNPEALDALAASGIRESNVQSVTIADSSGAVLAKVRRTPSSADSFTNALARRIGAQTGFQGALVFTRPIVENVRAADAPGSVRALPLGSVTVKLSEAHFAERQAQIILSGALILLVCLALSILLALSISASVVAPIERVIGMVQRFSSGHQGERVAERSGGELRQLERGINRMAASAERSQQQLQDQVDQATAELRGTLEEFEIKSVELDLARKRALAASRVKSEFLANMSHEIRTPMNALLGFSDLLTNTPLDAGQRGYLSTIQQSAHTLLTLLDNILDASRLEMSGMSVQKTRFVLHELLEDTLRVQAIGAYAKHLELVLDTGSCGARALLGDRIKLMRVLTNLVSNAIKFTDTGSVLVRTRCVPADTGSAQLTLEVIDTGIGIDAADQRRLFQPFSQAQGSADRRHEGAGLGLFISKRLVQLMGGTLSLESAPGTGSRFEVTLPLALVDDNPAPPPPPVHGELLVYEPSHVAADALAARLLRLGWKARMVDDLQALHQQLDRQEPDAGYSGLLLALSYGDLHDLAAFAAALPERAQHLPKLVLVNSVNAEVQAEAGRRLHADCQPKSLGESQLAEHLARLLACHRDAPLPPAHEPARMLRGHSIVIADDNRINRLLERILLEKHGAQVLEARNGDEVVALLAQHPVSLVLLDMQMPGEDGWQVAARLHARAQDAAAIPVIALSAMSSSKPAEELAAAGLSGWLMKPLEESALLELLGRYLRAAPSADPCDAHTENRALAQALGRLRPEVRQMLREDLPVQREAIENAWSRHDLEALRAAVHKLNGSAAFCRLTALRSVCMQLERQLQLGDTEHVPDAMARIAHETGTILDELARAALNPALPS